MAKQPTLSEILAVKKQLDTAQQAAAELISRLAGAEKATLAQFLAVAPPPSAAPAAKQKSSGQRRPRATAEDMATAEKAILAAVKKAGAEGISKAALTEKLSGLVSAPTLSAIVRKMVTAKGIKRSGKARGTKYTVVGK